MNSAAKWWLVEQNCSQYGRYKVQETHNCTISKHHCDEAAVWSVFLNAKCWHEITTECGVKRTRHTAHHLDLCLALLALHLRSRFYETAFYSKVTVYSGNTNLSLLTWTVSSSGLWQSVLQLIYRILLLPRCPICCCWHHERLVFSGGHYRLQQSLCRHTRLHEGLHLSFCCHHSSYSKWNNLVSLLCLTGLIDFINKQIMNLFKIYLF